MKLDLLLQQLGDDAQMRIPPVETWHPELSGDMDMEIRKDGSWWHEGVKFQREKLVRLFASILRKEGDEYFVLTPVEKWRIKVEDRPLFITLLAQNNNDIELVTSTGDTFLLGGEHTLVFSELDGIMLPEVKVRHDLWARFSRNAWYELLNYAQETADGDVVVISQGETFSLADAAE